MLRQHQASLDDRKEIYCIGKGLVSGSGEECKSTAYGI